MEYYSEEWNEQQAREWINKQYLTESMPHVEDDGALPLVRFTLKLCRTDLIAALAELDRLRSEDGRRLQVT
jgi:hypothetical protein